MQFELFYTVNNPNGHPYHTSKWLWGHNFTKLAWCLLWNTRLWCESWKGKKKTCEIFIWVHFGFIRYPHLEGVLKNCGHACLQFYTGLTPSSQSLIYILHKIILLITKETSLISPHVIITYDDNIENKMGKISIKMKQNMPILVKVLYKSKLLYLYHTSHLIIL